MNKRVLFSIQPQHCDNIKSLLKTWEIRKTRCLLEPPFKCLIYETITRVKETVEEYDSNYKPVRKRKSVKQFGGKVIGEFICDRILKFEGEFWDDKTFESIGVVHYDEDDEEEHTHIFAVNGEKNWLCKEACLEWEAFRKYIGQGVNTFYGFHISELKIYDKPKPLQNFVYYDKFLRYATNVFPSCDCWDMFIQKPPQSWCYVGV